MTEKSTKYYAVRNGHKIGVFNNWAECEQSIKGFSGAEYKSFKNKNEAYNFVYGVSKKKNVSNVVEDAAESDEHKKLRVIKAYVDGSYNKKTEEYGAGVVIINGNQKLTFSKKNNDSSLKDMRNVAGEILGAIIAMQFAFKNKENVDKLVIYHDYEGIAKWADNSWKTTKKGTQKYKEYYDQISEYIQVEFIKVKAHSGNEFNDEADQLAKKAIFENQEETIQSSELNLVKTEVKNGRYTPTYNILLNNKSFLLDDLNNKFKEEWKSKGNNLKDIDDIIILADFDKGFTIWKVTTKNNVEVIKVQL